MNAITELRTICRRSQATVLQDALGALALAVMLFVGLHLPNLL